MYLPSLIFAWLFGKFGLKGLIWVGVAIYLTCLGVALIDTGFIHYWLSMVLLGIGWNFLFLSGTNLLPYGYRPEERFRVQSVNDFLVFSVQAIAALGSGWFLYHWQWQGLLWVGIAMTLGFACLLWFSRAIDHTSSTQSLNRS